MNGPRFNHFFHYLLDIHNLKIEGKVKTVANPCNVKRLELILEEQLSRDQVRSLDDEEVEEDVGVDEVTIIYYNESCECINMCKTKKCPCVLNNTTCSEDCHIKNLKCKNK